MLRIYVLLLSKNTTYVYQRIDEISITSRLRVSVVKHVALM